MNEERDIIRSLYHKVPKHVWICFVSGIIFGVITHLYMLTNKLPNWDDINNLYGFGSGADYGRWFLQYVRPLMGSWSVPALNGMLTIVLLSVSACFIVLALDLHSWTSAVLIAVMTITFPSVTSLMTFMFTANTYAVGILLACAGAYCFLREKHGFIPAVVCFTLSLGMYQSYICLGAAILVLAMALDLIAGKEIRNVLLKGTKAITALAVTMIVYLGLVKVFANGYLSDDRGVSTMGQISVMRIPRLIMRAYKRISEYFILKPYSFISPTLYALNVICCIMIAAAIFLLLYFNKYYKDKIRTMGIIVLTLFVPLALASIYILAPETQDASMLMLYQYFFIYVLLIAYAEKILRCENAESRTGKRCTIIRKISSSCFVIAVILIGYCQFILAQEAYFRMDVAFKRVYSYYNRVIQRVEEQEAFQYGDEIALLGSFYETPLPMNRDYIDDEKFKDLSGVALENGLFTEGVRAGFINTYLGTGLRAYTEEEILEIKDTEEYENMPLYPAKGSVKKINDVWVVKLAEDEKYAEIK